MKRLFYSAVVITALLMSSCTPDNPVTPTTNNVNIGPQPKMQFKENGVLQIQDAVFESGLGWGVLPAFRQDGTITYLISDVSLHDSVGNRRLNINLTNNNLVNIGTYQSYSAYYNPIGCLPINNCGYGGSASVTITSISNNTASGTFSGTFSIYNITDGVFENIPIIH